MASNSGNPVFGKIEREVNAEFIEESKEKHVTFVGVLVKTLILFLIAVGSGVLSVYLSMISVDFLAVLIPIVTIAPLLALVFALVGSFSTKLAPVMSVLFSVFMGITLGLMVGLLEVMMPGIFIAAISTLFIVFGVTLLLYSMNAFRNKSRFYKIVSITGLSLMFVVLASFIISIFIDYTTYLWLMIVVNGVLVIYGAMMLVMDFDRATALAAANAPKKYEWQLSLGMLTSLIWMFIYILRLLVIIFSMLGRRRN